MSLTLRNFMKAYPNFALASQYGPVSDNINSTISFHNYFEQIFPNSQIDVTLNIFYFNFDGTEAGNFSLHIPNNSSIQFDASKENVKSDGLVVIAAVPNKDINLIKPSAIKIRHQITTGFYIKWEGKNGGVDIMHEWSSLSTSPIVKKIHHIGLLNKINIKYGLILMNIVIDEKSYSLPKLRLMNRSRSELLGEVTVDKIPSMCTKVLILNDIFPDIDRLLQENSSLVLDLIGENLAPPLTVEWHSAGDFHIHHL